MCQESLFVLIKRPEREADFLLAPSAEAKNVTLPPRVPGTELSYVFLGAF